MRMFTEYKDIELKDITVYFESSERVYFKFIMPVLD